ncbi:MAG: hypothetical protein NVS3B14_05640 [Ktedonobacteraceae bacterium]
MTLETSLWQGVIKILSAIDHIIIGAQDLEEAAAQFGQKLGLLASGGGIHPSGVTQVLSATIAVANLEEAARRFARIYGLQPSEPYTGDADGWDAMLVALPLGESGQHLELAMPLPLAPEKEQEVDMEHLPEAGALARHIERFGESVCRMTLAVSSLDGTRHYLDARSVTYTYSNEARPALWIHPDYACGAAIVLHEQG